MRKLLFLLVLLITISSYGAERINIEFFYQSGCSECEDVKTYILPRLKEELGGRYVLKKYDTGIRNNFIRLAEYQERLAPDRNDSVCMVLDGNVYLGGYKNIEDRLFRELAGLLEMSAQFARNNHATAEGSIGNIFQRRAGRFTLPTILIAGFLDGINPCVFSSLVFLLSLFSVANIKNIRLLVAGCAYCLACFLTYLGVGFGVFRFIRIFSGFGVIRVGIVVLMAVVLVVVAVISFVDAWRYRCSGAAGIRLGLPDKVKQRIHSIMRGGVRFRFLVPGAFVAGMLVTVLESVCTGQTYIPTLVLLVGDKGVGSHWFGYLLLYNLMFVLPLLVLFLSAYLGTSTSRLLEWSKREVFLSKILLGIFFVFLCVLLISTGL